MVCVKHVANLPPLKCFSLNEIIIIIFLSLCSVVSHLIFFGRTLQRERDCEVTVLSFGVVDKKPRSTFDAKTSYCTVFMA